MHRDAFALKIQRELCHPKCARKVSGLSRNRPRSWFLRTLIQAFTDHPWWCRSSALNLALKSLKSSSRFHSNSINLSRRCYRITNKEIMVINTSNFFGIKTSYLLAALATAFCSDGYDLNSASDLLSNGTGGWLDLRFSYPVSWFLVLSPVVAKLPVLLCSNWECPMWFEPTTGVDLGLAALEGTGSRSCWNRWVVVQLAGNNKNETAESKTYLLSKQRTVPEWRGKSY